MSAEQTPSPSLASIEQEAREWSKHGTLFHTETYSLMLPETLAAFHQYMASKSPSPVPVQLTKAHSLCRIKSTETQHFHCDVEYLVTGRATVKSTNGRQPYVYDGDTFDLVAVMKTDKESDIPEINKLFPPGTKHYVISLIGTKWEDIQGYELTDIDERDLIIHEVSEPIYSRLVAPQELIRAGDAMRSYLVYSPTGDTLGHKQKVLDAWDAARPRILSSSMG